LRGKGYLKNPVSFVWAKGRSSDSQKSDAYGWLRLRSVSFKEMVEEANQYWLEQN